MTRNYNKRFLSLPQEKYDSSCDANDIDERDFSQSYAMLYLMTTTY